MIKQKPPTKRELAMRRITCEYCQKKHFIKDGGWVITASNKVLCHSLADDDCFSKNKRKSNESP